MSFGFNVFDIVECFFEIKLGNEIVEKQKLQFPVDVMKQFFVQKMQELASTNQPYRMRIWYPQQIYNDNNEFVRTLNNEIKFGTHSYVRAFPDEYWGEEEKK